jgi:hypothetical protein
MRATGSMTYGKARAFSSTTMAIGTRVGSRPINGMGWARLCM